MKRMMLMTIVLSMMAVGGAKANNLSNDRGPKKRVTVVTISADPIFNLLFGGPHHDCCHHHKPKMKSHHAHHHNKCNMGGTHHHGHRDKYGAPHHKELHKGHGRPAYHGNSGRGHHRR